MTTIINQPPTFSVKLHVHQRYNIFQAYLLEKQMSAGIANGNFIITNVGIFGDTVGTGKTLTVLGLVWYHLQKMKAEDELDDLKIRVGTNTIGNIQIYKHPEGKHIPTTIVVTSLSVFSQWEIELKKTQLRYSMVKTRANFSNVEGNDVIVVTVNMYKDFMKHNSKYRFVRLVYDEMDSAHIPAMTTPNACFVWLVSATYKTCLNGITGVRHFLKRTFDINRDFGFTDDEVEEIFKSITIKSPQKLLDMCKIEYKCNMIHYNVKVPAVIRHFGEYFDVNVIEMIESGNIAGAIESLGGSHSDSNIAEVMRRRAFEKWNNAKIDLDAFNRKHPQVNPNDERLVKIQTRIERAKASLDSIEERIESMKDEDCPICYTTPEMPTLLSCCQNVACAACIATCVTKMQSCPFCRALKPILTSFNNPVEEEKKEGEECPICFIEPESKTFLDCCQKFGCKNCLTDCISKNGSCPFCRAENPNLVSSIEDEKDEEKVYEDKFKLSIEIIQKAKKVLMFSSHDNQFRTISHYLVENGISCATVSGTVGQRDKAIESYKNGDIKVLILNSRMNGAGLNLQATTDIIFWHQMSPEITQQIIGRAYRFGLDHDVNIHKFFSQDEIWNDNGNEIY